MADERRQNHLLKFDVHTTTSVMEHKEHTGILKFKQTSAPVSRSGSNTHTASPSGSNVLPSISIMEDDQASDKFYDAQSTPAVGSDSGRQIHKDTATFAPLQKVQEHVQHLRTRVELKTSHVSATQKQLHALKCENDSLQATVNSLREDLDAYKSRLEHSEQLTKHRAEQARQAAQRCQTLSEDKTALRQENDELKQKLDGVGQGDFEAKLEAEEQILALETKLAQKSKRIEHLESELASLKSTQTHVNGGSHACSESQSSAVGEMREMRKQLDQLQKSVVLKDAQLNRCTCNSQRRTSSMEDALVNKVHVLNATVAEMKRALEEGGTPRADGAHSMPASVHEELGTLRATKQFLTEKIDSMENSVETLNQELSVTQEKVKALQEELSSKQQQLEQTEGEAEGAQKYMDKALSDAKKQKIDLRLKNLDLERKLSLAQQQVNSNEHKKALEKCQLELEAALANVQSTKAELASAATDNEATSSKLSALQTQLDEQKRRNSQLQSELDSAKSDLAVKTDLASHGKKKLEERVDTLTKEVSALRAAYHELESQFDEQHELKKQLTQKYTNLRSEHEGHLKQCTGSQAKWRADMEKRDAMLLENVRLKKKAEFLQEELEATHADYKEELSRVAAQVRDAQLAAASAQQKQPTPSENRASPLKRATESKVALETAAFEAKAHREHAEAENRRIESELKASKRLVQELKKENEKLSEQLSQQATSVSLASEVRAKLETAARDALEKGERYKKERDEVAATVLELRQAVAKASQQQKEAERYKQERDDSRTECDRIELQSRQIEARNREEIRRLTEQKAQIEKLTDYLQAQVVASTAPGSRKRDMLANKLGGLLHVRPPSPDGGNRVADAGRLPPAQAAWTADERRRGKELQTKIDQLQRQLDSERRNATVPRPSTPAEHRPESASLSREAHSLGTRILAHREPSPPISSPSPTKAPSKQLRFDACMSPAPSATTTSSGADERANSQASASTAATMRHDIPHRWRPFFVLRPAKCACCLDGIPLIRQAAKCLECSVVVHRGCADALMNTCGLPDLYTDFYLEEQLRVEKARAKANAAGTVPKLQNGSPDRKRSCKRLQDTPAAHGRMCGWVKLWRTDHTLQAQWTDAWACMDEEKLAFYETQERDTPFQSIDLAKQQWRIRFQREADDAQRLPKHDVPYVLEIKIIATDASPAYRLYMMAPTLQAKQRWVHALHTATSRLDKARRSDSIRAEKRHPGGRGDGVWLRLCPPHNLQVHTAAVFNTKFVLFGCDEGLFFTDARRPSIPYRVAGLSTVYQMEVLTDIDCLIVIAGDDRQLCFVHLTELSIALDSAHPAVTVTTVPKPTLCHLFATHQVDGVRYLLVAEPDNVHVFGFSERMQVFKMIHSVRTREPVMSITPLGDCVLVAAEKFYELDPQTAQLHAFLSADRDPSLTYYASSAATRGDYPTDAIKLTQNELLLVYANTGVFVSIDGKRSRVGEVEWIRTPLQLHYTAPYLFMMHYDSIEIFSIPPHHSGIHAGSITSVQLITASACRVLGRGANAGDLFVSTVSNELADATDILSLNAVAQGKRVEKKLVVKCVENGKGGDVQTTDL